MKKNILALTMILIAVLVAAVIPTEAEGEIYSDTIRLHILADSDDDAAQNLKIRIRDRILEDYGSKLSAYNSREEAENCLSSMTAEIENSVNEYLMQEGADYFATVTLSEEKYERREYENFTLPAGEYLSLRIILGRGEGKNWWCVMYPPLCLDIATDDYSSCDIIPGYTESETALINCESDRYKVKFKLLELVSELVG